MQRSRKTTWSRSSIGISFFAVGVSLLFLAGWLRILLLLLIALVFLVVAFITGIVTCAASFRGKNFWSRCSTIAGVLFLSVPLITVMAFLLSLVLPHIYTPPAITPVNLAVYNRCIEFIKNHDQYPNLGWDRHGYVRVKGESYMTFIPYFREEFKKEAGFSEDELVEIERIYGQFGEISCYKVQRDNNIVLFYKLTNYILPDRPGVLHSLDGKNPNEIDTEPLNKNKPFIKIGGDWYMSRHLVARHWRNLNFPIPKSLIDHSLRTKGIDLDKNTELQAVQSNINSGL